MNPDLILPVLTFIIMLIIFPLTIFIFFKKELKAKRIMERTATLLGLESSRPDLQSFMDGNPAASKIPPFILKLLTAFVNPVYTGKVRGYDVKIHFERRGSSRNKTMYTVISLAFEEALFFDISVKKEGVLGRLANLTGFKDISLNDEEFDSLLRVKGSNESAVRDLLIEKYRRDALTALFSRHENMEMEKRGFRYEREGYINDYREVTELFNHMADAADVFRN